MMKNFEKFRGGLLVLTLLAAAFLTGCDMDRVGDVGAPSSGDVVLNELLASNDTVNQDPDYGEYGDWVELHNKGTETQDIGGWTLADSGAEWTIPSGTTIPAGGYLIIWCDDYDAAATALHANFKLGAGGDEVTLRDAAGGYRDGLTFPAQDTDVAYGRVPDGEGTWQVLDAPSPAAANGGAAPADVDVYLNELLASNDTVNQDPDYGEYGDWLELVNTGSEAADIGGWTVADSGAEWTFPTGTTIPAGGYLIIWCDDHDAAATALHANFKLSGGGEDVTLKNGSGEVQDTLTYPEQETDVTYGRNPDGSGDWAAQSSPTPGAANSGAAPAEQIYINELQADNETTVADPDEGLYSDWIELYNPGTSPVDISGWSLTDDLADPTKWVVPAGVSVPAEGYIVVWCDGVTGGTAVHADFSLSKNGEDAGLFDASGNPVDTLTFDAMNADESFARTADGGDTWAITTTPTPGAANQ